MITALLLTFMSLGAHAQAELFDGDEILSLTLEAPMRQLIRNRLDKPEYPGRVVYSDSSGQEVSVPVMVASRGNARLDTCAFPPLRLRFRKKETGGTIFAGQKKLKMVTHCERGSDATGWVLQEYGTYKAFNAITEASYRVRRLQVTYRDVESSRWQREGPAFLIEDTGQLAGRLGMVEVRPPEVRTEQYDSAALTTHMLFQMLIGNTDFSVIRGQKGEGCCHNARVITRPGSQEGWIVVPYDFDQSGIIKTDYALPDTRLGIRSVATRLYRGFCWQNDALPDAIASFNQNRDAITQALLPEGLSNPRARRTKRYVERFYEIVNDSGELEKQLINKCRGRASFPVRDTRTKK